MNAMQNLINEGFIIFTFEGLTTYLNKLGIEKKQIIKMRKWEKINETNFIDFINPDHKGFALITGKMSNVTVIDFDDYDVYQELILEKPEIKNIRTIRTRNGVHLYCKYDEAVKTTTDGFRTYKKVDIRNDDGIVFCPPTKYKLLNGTYAVYEDLGGEILPIPECLMLDLKNAELPQKKEKREIIIKDNSNEEMVNLQFIDNAITSGLLNFKATSGSYDDWRDTGFIFKHTSPTEKGFELFDKFSKINDTLYDKDYTKAFWKSIKQTDKPLTIKTLKSWIKQQKYDITQDKIFVSSDKEAGDYLYDKLKDRLVYCCKTLYFKNGNKWINDEKEMKILLRDYVMCSNIYRANDKNAVIPYSQNISNAKNAVEVIIGIAYNNTDNGFYDKFATSTKTKLCFNDGVLNLKTKKFTLWENIPANEEVFTTFTINRDYNEVRNDPMIKKVYEDVFVKIFGNDAKRALNMYARAMAGHVEDKAWGLFIGSRNCGKGVIENFFKQTFQNYISSINTEVFLCERVANGGDSAKKLSWMFALEFSRLTFTQESPAESANLKIDGNKIKKLASGGDTISARKNYQDERELKVQSTLMFNANDFLPITPMDTMETCVTFASTKQFKTQEFINSRRENCALEQEISMYQIADPNIKLMCSTKDWMDALVHLVMDYYVDKAVPFVNQFLEDDTNTNLMATILSVFEITKDRKDKISNKDLKDWTASNGISFGTKLKPMLKNWGCSDYRLNTGERGMQGLRLIVKEPIENEE